MTRTVRSQYCTHRACLCLTARQYHCQLVAIFHLRDRVHHYLCLRRSRANTPAYATACDQVVRYLDDLPRRSQCAVQANGKSDCLCLFERCQQQPLSKSCRLGLAGAAEGRHLNLTDAVATHSVIVLDGDYLLATHVRHVIPTNQRHRDTVFTATARIIEYTTQDVTLVVGEYVITGHVCNRDSGTCRPVHHAPEDRGEVHQYLQGITSSLQIQIAGKARLSTATAIRHHLVAVSPDLVERPLVDIGIRDQVA